MAAGVHAGANRPSTVARAVALATGHTRFRFGRRHRQLLGLVAVVVLLSPYVGAMVLTASAPGPLHHLGYLPILLAAYVFGIRGGLAVAIVPALLSGPYPFPVQPHPELWTDVEGRWIRACMFMLVGGLTGLLFDRMRLAVSGWRTEAISVAEREHEGMIALARGAEAKDSDTGDHILRVQLVAERLAAATGMAPPTAHALGLAAMLHDVGKLHVPDRILLKPGPLDSDEWVIMRLHSIWGEEILGTGPGFRTARQIARWHHENFDGSGYPDHLRREHIPLEARIVRVADSFDAMTHTRPYQEAQDLEWALTELKRCAGRDFDPELVRLLIQIVERDSAFARALVQADLRELHPEHRRFSAPLPGPDSEAQQQLSL
ncbi:MAG: cyclic di-GMP phosphodiesterase [Chloroflexota bacterium]|nr:cyclic di-GMP phosphodiesterase [Chloroflexota bacterium]